MGKENRHSEMSNLPGVSVARRIAPGMMRSLQALSKLSSIVGMSGRFRDRITTKDYAFDTLLPCSSYALFTQTIGLMQLLLLLLLPLLLLLFGA